MGNGICRSRDAGWRDSTERVIVDNMGTEEKECLLYLPLYDELKSLEIGVSSDAHIHKGENPFKEKIVVYGSSILQGASASRPGMAYPPAYPVAVDIISLIWD